MKVAVALSVLPSLALAVTTTSTTVTTALSKFGGTATGVPGGAPVCKKCPPPAPVAPTPTTTTTTTTPTTTTATATTSSHQTYPFPNRTAVPVPAVSATPQCVDGLYMLFARGSKEPPGYGRMGEHIGPMINYRIPYSRGVPLPYPAYTPMYNSSVHEGTKNMRTMVRKYVDACPGRPVALFGYSQGAQVVGDTICGSIEHGPRVNKLPLIPPLEPHYLAMILATVQMGDPTFVPGLPWHIGNATTHGLFPRQEAQRTCEPLDTRMRTYCNQGDFACASGHSVHVHLSYIPEYKHQVTDFVAGRWAIFKRYNQTTVPPGAPIGPGNSNSTEPGSGGGGGGGGGGGRGGGGSGGCSGDTCGGGSPDAGSATRASGLLVCFFAALLVYALS